MQKKKKIMEEIDLKTQSGYLHVKINNTVLDELTIQRALNQIKDQADQNAILIFDFLETTEISAEALQFLNLLTGSTEQRRSRTAFLMNENLKKKIAKLGFSEVFPTYPNLKSALRERAFEIRPDAINFLNFVRESVFQTLFTLTKTKAKAGGMYKRENGETPNIEIAGVIGIFSKNFQATIILGFEKKTYLELMGRMHSKEYTSFEPEIHDGAAELISQIVDNARLGYGVAGAGIEKSIATIAVGAKVQIFIEKNPSLIIPITTDFGEMFLEMTARPPMA